MRLKLAVVIVTAALAAGCARTRGEALARVSLLENGRPGSVKIISETPPGSGFGASARSLIFDLSYYDATPGDYMMRVTFIRSSDYEIELCPANETDPVGPVP